MQPLLEGRDEPLALLPLNVLGQNLEQHVVGVGGEPAYVGGEGDDGTGTCCNFHLLDSVSSPGIGKNIY